MMENSGGKAVTYCTLPLDSEPRKKADALHPIKILLIEDDGEAAELVRIFLNEDPSDAIRVEWSPTISYGITRLMEPGVDAILLDLGMPELTGYMSFSVIEAAADPVIPVVILTADDRPHVRQLAMARGAADYLLKGQSTPLQLRQTLRQAVQGNWLI